MPGRASALRLRVAAAPCTLRMFVGQRYYIAVPQARPNTGVWSRLASLVSPCGPPCSPGAGSYAPVRRTLLEPPCWSAGPRFMPPPAPAPPTVAGTTATIAATTASAAAAAAALAGVHLGLDAAVGYVVPVLPAIEAQGALQGWVAASPSLRACSSRARRTRAHWGRLDWRTPPHALTRQGKGSALLKVSPYAPCHRVCALVAQVRTQPLSLTTSAGRRGACRCKVRNSSVLDHTLLALLHAVPRDLQCSFLPWVHQIPAQQA